MKNKLHLDEHTWEAMEACRSDANDLADPAMSRLEAELAANPELVKTFDHIQHLDRKIGAAFHDLSIPPGMVQRVFDNLSLARAQSLVSSAINNGPDQTTDIDTAISSPTQNARKVSRRWLLLAGGLLSAAAVLFISLWLNLRNVESYSEQTALDEAIRFFDTDAADSGFLLAERSPPKAYQFSRTVFLSKGIHWRKICDFLGRTGIAYDLPGRDGGRATLYVIEQSAQGLGNEPQYHPFTTGGYSASAWKEGGLLYVLVVQGEPHTYQNYLNLPRGPVA
jgi:anti-sigma factor RsiW